MKVYFRLNGGLGNQLSQYAAAKYYENKYSIKIGFDNYYINISKKSHENIILDDLFSNLICLDSIKSKISRFINRFLYKFGIRSIDILGYKFQFDYFEFDAKYNGVYVIEGFWQDNYIYTKTVANDIYKSIVSKLNFLSSKVLCDHQNDDCNFTQVAMHIRRGDYLTNKKFFRQQQIVLPNSYYQNAIKFIKNKYNNKIHITIFSDDEIDPKLFAADDVEIRIIVRNDYTDLESFYLFSNFCHLIIANSTYSMWAALIGYHNQNCEVYAPSIWHKNSVEDISIIPRQFILISENNK